MTTGTGYVNIYGPSAAGWPPDSSEAVKKAVLSAGQAVSSFKKTADSDQNSPINRAKASLGRIAETTRIRSDIQARLRAMDEKGAAKDDPGRIKLIGLIQKCDKQIQNEIDYLNALEKENPGTLNTIAAESSKLPIEKQTAVPYTFTYAPEEEKKGYYHQSGNLKFQSPYAYWLDKDIQKKETDRWAEMIDKICEQFEKTRTDYTKHLGRQDLVKIQEQTRYDPDARLRLAAAFAGRPT
ncbi:MAG: hypothetical protein AABZ57_04995 [Candidatus Margulisiibacteriota bacterium]